MRALDMLNRIAIEGWCIGLALLVGQPVAAWAQDAERAQLAAERQRLLDQYAAQERACREQFVVTACVDDVRLRRRLALQPLRARELSLDEAERARRALDRLSARAARASEARLAASAAGAAPGSSASAPAAASAPATVKVPTAAGGADHRVPSASPAPPARDRATGHADPSVDTRALQAAERARAATRRAQALDALQAEVARKSAEQARSARKSAPLPAPSPAAAVASTAAAGH